jgi:general stress protein 26
MSDSVPVPPAAGRLSQVLDLVETIRIAFLVTMSHEGEFHARPVQTLGIEPDGVLTFFSDVSSEKAEEVLQDMRVGLVYADTGGNRYVAIRGAGRIARNPRRARELWRVDQLAYYPQGPDDDRLGVLTVRIEHAEYWLAPGRVSHLVAALKAAVSGVPVGVEGENAQVRNRS